MVSICLETKDANIISGVKCGRDYPPTFHILVPANSFCFHVFHNQLVCRIHKSVGKTSGWKTAPHKTCISYSITSDHSVMCCTDVCLLLFVVVYCVMFVACWYKVLGEVGALPDIYTELEINYFLLRRLLGVRTEGDKRGAKVSDYCRTCLNVHVGTCMFVHVDRFTHACLYRYTCMHVHICMCTHIFSHVHVCEYENMYTLTIAMF